MKKPINISSIQKTEHLDPNYLPLTMDSIKKVEDAVENDPVYGNGANGGVLREYFSSKKENTDEITILHKIMLIDYTYSTNLSMYKNVITLSELTEIIRTTIDLDKRINDGCIDVVDEIINKVYQKTNGKYTPLSFVSKYCTVNNCIGCEKDSFSIYDNIVADAIPKYLDIKDSYQKDWEREKQYDNFHSLISKMIEVYGLDKNDSHIRRKLDHFLWYPNRLNKVKVAIKKVLEKKLKNKLKIKDITAQVLMPEIVSEEVRYPVKLNRAVGRDCIDADIENKLAEKLYVKENLFVDISESGFLTIRFPIKKKDEVFLEPLLALWKKINSPKES